MAVKSFIYPSHDVMMTEKKTFRLHLISQLLSGVSLGILLLQDVILKKSLFGTDFQVTILIFLTSAAFLLSIYGAEIINRAGNRARAIMVMGIASKMFLIFIPFFENAGYFIFCIAVMSFLDSMLKPAWNIIYKHNYTDQNRNRLYSYAASFSTVTLLLVSTFSGYFLDIDYRIYKILFPIAGILDIIVYRNLSKMMDIGPFQHQRTGTWNFTPQLVEDILILPVKNTLWIFKKNPAFRRFEMFYFIYGAANMLASPVIPIFMVNDLQLDYTPISFARGLIFHSALILFTPVMGRIHGRGNPAKFCGYMFAAISVFPFLMIATKYLAPAGFFTVDNMLFLSFFAYGFAMSGITISWNLSSIYYAPDAEVSNYQAAHITLTGVRGIFSPLIGFAVLTMFSVEWAFLISAGLYLIASFFMFREYRRSKNIDIPPITA